MSCETQEQRRHEQDHQPTGRRACLQTPVSPTSIKTTPWMRFERRHPATRASGRGEALCCAGAHLQMAREHGVAEGDVAALLLQRGDNIPQCRQRAVYVLGFLKPLPLSLTAQYSLAPRQIHKLKPPLISKTKRGCQVS